MITIYLQKLNLGEDPHLAGQAMIRKVFEKDVSLSKGPHGKPYLTDGSAFFNLSHCEGLLGLAVGSQEVGLDLEPRERVLRKTAFCLKGEEEMDPLCLWVLKESFAKWSGEGLSILRKVQVAPRAKGSFIGRYMEKQAVLQPFEYEGYLGSLAALAIEEFEIKEL